MKSVFLKALLCTALLGLLPMSSYGASGAENTENQTGSEIESNLLLWEVITQDDMHISISFNQNIVPEAVRVGITKQSDGSNVKVDKITGVTNTPESVVIALSDVLEEGATYTITIKSAISESWVVIKEGADAVREFTTPTPLKKSVIVFNAPPNPNAVVATGSKTNTGVSTTEKTWSGTASPSKTATELPLTGMNPLIFLLIAWSLAFILVSRKKA